MSDQVSQERRVPNEERGGVIQCVFEVMVSFVISDRITARWSVRASHQVCVAPIS